MSYRAFLLLLEGENKKTKVVLLPKALQLNKLLATAATELKCDQKKLESCQIAYVSYSHAPKLLEQNSLPKETKTVEDIFSDGCTIAFRYPVHYKRAEKEPAEEEKVEQKESEDIDLKTLFSGLSIKTIIRDLQKREKSAISSSLKASTSVSSTSSTSLSTTSSKPKTYSSPIEKCWLFFDINASTIMKRIITKKEEKEVQLWCSLSPSLLNAILMRDTLDCSEIMLLQVLLIWAKAQCKQSSSSSSSTTKSVTKESSSKSSLPSSPSYSSSSSSSSSSLSSSESENSDSEDDSLNKIKIRKEKNKSRRKKLLHKKKMEEDSDEEKEEEKEEEEQIMKLEKVNEEEAKILADHLKYIRFALMSLTQIAGPVTSSGVLTQQQLLDLFQYSSMLSTVSDTSSSTDDESTSKPKKSIVLPTSLKCFSTKKRQSPSVGFSFIWDKSINGSHIEFSADGRTLKKHSDSPDVVVCVGNKPISGKMKCSWKIKVHSLNDEMWIGITSDKFSLTTCYTSSIRHHLSSWHYKDGSRSDANFEMNGVMNTKVPSQYRSGDTLGFYVDVGNGIMKLYKNDVLQSETNTLPKDKTYWPMVALDYTNDWIELLKS
eukprot:TRINITY_DN471_c0_g1_i3.p1 TRINITY_DN471_c0_g1~~TRINITY_DN471_c0_g1_i3.p1  ORF type:complete len:625 (+),score=199.14 TRINITY_DN471_c0_g1_i3:70-1875(+)